MIQSSGSPRIAETAANRSACCGVALTGAPAQSPALTNVAGRGFFFAVSACPAGAATGKAGERMALVVKGDEHGSAPADGEAVGAFSHRASAQWSSIGCNSPEDAGSIPARASSLSRLETGRSTARPRGGASVVGSIPTIRAESKSAASGNRRTELVRYSSDGGERPAPYSWRLRP